MNKKTIISIIIIIILVAILGCIIYLETKGANNGQTQNENSSSNVFEKEKRGNGNIIVDLVKEIQNTYNIDKNRTYTTGQAGEC